MKLIVVGAGIAGSCVARHARARGHYVIVVDRDRSQAASNAALCVARRSWFKGWERDRLDYALAWYLSHGWLEAQGALVTNMKGETSEQHDWSLINPHGPLVEPDIQADVQAVHHDDGTVVFSDGDLRADAVIVTAGIDSNRFALDEPDTPLWGVTWVCPLDGTNGLVDDVPIRVVHTGPYRSLIGARVGGIAKLGSSRATTPERAREIAGVMFTQAMQRGLIKGGPWSTIEGCRAVAAEPGAPRRLGAKTWRLSGFGRVGYSQAPARARDLVRVVEAASHT